MTVAREDGTPVCESCTLADSPRARLKGLLGHAGLERGEGMLLRPAPAIHTWFMRFPIDGCSSTVTCAWWAWRPD